MRSTRQYVVEKKLGIKLGLFDSMHSRDNLENSFNRPKQSPEGWRPGHYLYSEAPTWQGLISQIHHQELRFVGLCIQSLSKCYESDVFVFIFSVS